MTKTERPTSTMEDPRISPTLMRRAVRKTKRPPTPPARPSPGSLWRQANSDYQTLARENLEERKKSRRLEKLYESICVEMKRQHVLTCETRFKYETARLTMSEMREKISGLEKERRDRVKDLEIERRTRKELEIQVIEMNKRIVQLEKDRKSESRRERERINAFGTYGAYRQILGTSSCGTINTTEISKRFRYLAKLVHPDKCSAGDQQQQHDSKRAFQILKDAYEELSKNPSLKRKATWETLYRENHLKDEEIRLLRIENSRLKSRTLIRRSVNVPAPKRNTTPPVSSRTRRKKRTPPRRGHTKSLFQDDENNIINEGVCKSTGMACKNCAAGRGCRWAGRGRPGHL